jgi:hypothetical protein
MNSTTTITDDTTTATQKTSLAPGTTLLRHEDNTDNSIVYTVDNRGSDTRWQFTLDFRESSNFFLLPVPAANVTSNDKGLLRRIVVPSHGCLEVARLSVVNPKLESSLKVHYGWEEQPPTALGDHKEAFVDYATTKTKREALSTDVDLLTSRTDQKDGHSKFVYRIESKRRESLKIVLDFTGSENLAFVNSGVHNRLARFIMGNQTRQSTGAASDLITQVRVTKGTTRVAKLKTVVPRQGWALNHNVTFEMQQLCNDLTKPTATHNETKSDDGAGKALATAAATPPLPNTATHTKSQLPQRMPQRRISLQHRSSAGFERGILAAASPTFTTNEKTVTFDDTTIETKVDTPALDTVNDILVPTTTETTAATPGVVSTPSRMSWLDAEIFQHVNGTMEETKESVGRQSLEPFAADPNMLENKVYQLLLGMQLHEMYYSDFESEAFNSIELLLSLAQDDKSDFRTALKEIGISKAGHREQILQGVLATAKKTESSNIEE